MLRAVRDEIGMSRAALALRLGISPKTIQSWENGRTFIERLELIPRLESELGCSLSRLIAQASGAEQLPDATPAAPQTAPRMGPLQAKVELAPARADCEPDVDELENSFVAVPIITAAAAMGPVSEIHARSVHGQLVVPADWMPRSGVVAALRMADSAMSPMFPIGGMVVVDLRPVDPAKAVGKPVAVVLREKGLRIRRIFADSRPGRLYAAGCNGKRARQPFRGDSGDRIVGMVIGSVSRVPLI